MSSAPSQEEAACAELAQQIVAVARKKGVAVAEAVVSQGQHLEAKVRLGKPELLEEAGSRSLGLRVMLGSKGNYRSASAFSSDVSRAGIEQLVDDARELAELNEVDACFGPTDEVPAPAAEIDLKLFDAGMADLDGAYALAQAKAAEAAAFAYDPRVKNSEGASFSRSSGARAIATSYGFSHTSRGTYASLALQAVVDDTDAKKRSGHHWTAQRFTRRLMAPEAVGREAARRALSKLGSRKVPTGDVAVVFDPEVGRGIISLLAGCISGGSIWRKSSYLAGKLGQNIASPLVSIVDDPLIPEAPGSRSVDGEGYASRVNPVVQQGVLTSYLLDTYSARKLNLEAPHAPGGGHFSSTASASRGGTGGVSVATTNFYMKKGSSDPKDIVRKTKRGLYVTDMMGFGFNAITGDFSRGAAGFWIEDGELTFPVSEVTLSLNIDDLYKRIDMVGNDLEFKTSVAAPTFRVSSMTLSGTTE